MSTTNTIPVSTLGGGSSYTGPFPFRATAADFGTPVVTGTIADITVTDATYPGLLEDVVYIVVTDPVAATVVQIPITLPVTPLPDRFDLVLNVRSYGTDDFYAILGFLNAAEDLFFGFQALCTNSVSVRPAMTFIEGTGTTTTGTYWEFPDLEFGQSLVSYSSIEKNVPFTYIPKFSVKSTFGTQESNTSKVSGELFTNHLAGGTIDPDWLGEDFETVQLILVFPSTTVGTAEVVLELEFLPHVKDR